MADRADPVHPVLWTPGPGRRATAAARPARTGVADFVAAVWALVRRYGGRPTVLLVRDAGAASWSSASVTPAATLGAVRVAVTGVAGPAVEVAFDEAVTFHFAPEDGSAWSVTVSSAAAPEDDAALDRIVAHVTAFLTAPDDLPLDEVDHRSPAERELFDAVNRTARPVGDPVVLHRRVELAVDAFPERVAVVHGELTLTYARLDGLANALAARITAAGVGPGGRVGVAAARGAGLVVAALAAMKAGAAYVPLDPLMPRARQEALHRIGKVDLVLVEAGLDVPLAESVPALALAPVDELPSAPRSAVAAPVDGGDLAYVIFTSGSTGEPKGALLDHVGRVSMIRDLSERVGLTASDRILAVSSPSFDMTVLDIFAALMAGAAIVLPERGRENDVEHWVELVEDAGVTVWHSVPSALTLFLNAWGVGRTGALRVFLLGGDWIPLSQPEAVWRAFPGAHFVSLGGATEVSVDSTYYSVAEVDPAWRSIPYGRPMGNQNAYVLDAHGRPAGVDQVGELYLGGLGVGWGYQDRPGFTASKFVPDPFSGRAGARMYRTGDLARLRGDGELELIGRVDQQVKVGGVRIELGEIQACLREHPRVGEAVVVAVRDAAGHAQSLCAYVVEAEASVGGSVVGSVGGAVDLAVDARRHLLERLPASMVPARIVVVDDLPVNANGKIARGELELRAATVGASGAGEGGDDGLVAVVAEIWREVLGLPEPPAADESFLALGGGSLAAIQVAGRLNRRFATEVKVSDLVDAETVARVAAVVTAQRGRAARPALTRRRRDVIS
ncbi:MAG: non-ribosomal peptide synthetase [Saccharothrix sp.]|nr:non-ribosomal peptide synthetase [Saccharothrix sp.]